MGRSVGRKVRDGAEARALLERWTGSGEALSTWCAKERINWYSLVAFQRWPDRDVQPKKKSDFVEVEATALVRATPSARSSRYRVVVGELAVEVEPDFDDAVLQRLLRVVATC